MTTTLLADRMVTTPVIHGPGTTVDEARRALDDPHRHMVLIVSGRRLLGTLVRDDLVGRDGLALDAAVLDGRTSGPGASLARVWSEMAAAGERRRAVVDERGDLVGLLCLKASGDGWCSDEGIAGRRSEDFGGS